jgi:hypothetical protein
VAPSVSGCDDGAVLDLLTGAAAVVPDESLLLVSELPLESPIFATAALRADLPELTTSNANSSSNSREHMLTYC